jgi:signal transduction histidine kinase
VQSKMLAAFLLIVGLLILLGALGLQSLREMNERSEELNELQRKITAYRHVQHGTTRQLYGVTSALHSQDDRALDGALRQLSQFGYDLDRLQHVATDEREVLSKVRMDYERFIEAVSNAINYARAGRLKEARALQLNEARPLADRLERLTNKLVNLAEADMLAGIKKSRQAYSNSRIFVVGFSVGSILLALGLGYVFSWSIIRPLKKIETRLRKVAAGEFTEHVTVASRDELGELAANLNRTCDELARLYQELEEASRHKSQFVANMSHELRTPLAAMLGYTELLLDGLFGELPEKAIARLERVQANGKHLLGLINAVLDISRIEAGQFSLNLGEYALSSLIETVRVATESLASEKGLELHTEVAPQLPSGFGDEQRLMQVLLNLVGNAIKFTDTGMVAVTASLENDEFAIYVRDTGPGIAPAQQGRIFEEFQQVDSTDTKTKGGTGLGLAISKQIIDMHGGRIGVESELGAGATFHIRLPVRVPAQGATT